MRPELAIVLLRSILGELMPHLEKLAADSETDIDDAVVRILKTILGL